MPMRQSISNASSRPAGWGIVPVGAASLARELPIVLGGIGLFYSVLAFARYWSGPVNSQAEISLDPAALPKYALFSVLRLAIAYMFSFVLVEHGLQFLFVAEEYPHGNARSGTGVSFELVAAVLAA
jgi:hypothetical protein